MNISTQHHYKVLRNFFSHPSCLPLISSIQAWFHHNITRESLDRLMSPAWRLLSNVSERHFFRALILITGDNRIFSELCASYIRYSRRPRKDLEVAANV